jgi:ATP-dependent DNA helicase RecQ
MLKVLDVDGAVRRVRGGWVATGQEWHYDQERYARVARTRAAEQQAMLAYAAAESCRMEFLRRQLDDPSAAPCGRCDRCTGRSRSTEVSAETLAAARAMLGRPGIEVEPRRQWPSGLPALGVNLKGRIPAGEQAAVGRALGRLSDIGWGNRLRPLFAPGAPDAPVAPEVLDAVVSVLADWSRGPGAWDARPVGVVTTASLTRPQLVESLGEGIARVGRLPLLGRVEYARPPRGGRSNSAQRVRTVAESLTVPEELAAALAAAPGPVLLVDDFTDSGWTLAVAARLLRRAGAAEVLPLVLAQQG